MLGGFVRCERHQECEAYVWNMMSDYCWMHYHNGGWVRDFGIA